MAYSVGTAYLDILPSMQGLQRNIENELRGVNADRAGRQAGDDYSGGFGGAAKKITGVLGAAFAAVKVGDFAKDAVAQASDLAESATKLEAVFGDGTDAINEFATQGAKALGQSNLAVKDAAATFGVFGKAAGLAGKDNAKFSSDLVSLSTDLASFYNSDPSTVVEALGAGLRGEAEPLRQFGILMDDATLKAKAMSLGLITTTKDALTPQQKVLAAQAVIMEQTSLAQGDFARTSGGLANQQRILAAQFEDMKGKLGAAFLPAVTAVVTALNEKLFPAFDLIGEKIQGPLNFVKSYLQDFTGAMQTLFTGDFNPAQWFAAPEEDSGLVTFLLDTRDTAVGAFNTIKSYAQDTGAALKTIFTGEFDPSQWFSAPSEDSPLVDFLFNIREAAEKVGASIGPIFQQIKNALGPVFEEIGSTLGPAVVETFGKLWDAISPLVPTILDLVSAFNPFSLMFKALEPVLPKIVDLLAELVDSVGGVLAKALQAVGPLLEKLVGAFMDFVPVLVDALMPILPVIVDVLTDLADVIGDALISAIDALTPLFTTITDVIAELLPFVAELVKKLLPPLQKLFESLAPAVKSILDVLVPLIGKIADGLIPVIEALQPIIERVFTFIADTIGNVVQVFQGVIDFITGVFSGDWDKAWQGIQEIFGGIWNQIKNIFSTLWDVVSEFFVNLLPRIGEMLTGWRDQLWEWGSQFIGWIWQGIQDLWTGTIWPWFKALPGLVWDGIKAGSAQMVTWGGEFLSWLWDGISSFWTGTIWPWFTSLPQTIWDSITSFAGGAGAWLTARGSEFLGWVWDGITSKSEEVKQWFMDLPGTIWDAVKGIWSSATSWGAELMKYVIDGITGADPYVSAALAKTMLNAASGIGIDVSGVVGFLTGVDVNKNIDDYLAHLQVSAAQANPSRPFGNEYRGGGRATGGLFGPYRGDAGGLIVAGTHGTADDVLIRGSKDEFMVNARATAQHLPLLEYINDGGTVPGFAGGGLLGGMGKFMGGFLVKAILPQILSGLTDSVKNSAVASNGQWGPGTDGSGLAANTQAARDFIVSKWGITNIGGVYGGSVPGSDHPIGKALDVMIANYLSAAGIAQGTSVADWFIQNPNSFGTRYVIWRDRINEGGTWSPYQHPSGSNDTLQHRDHVHLSFLTGSGQFGGGAAPAGDDNPKKSGFLGALIDAFAGTFKTKLAPAVSYTASAGTEQWRSTVLQALGITGQPTSYADIVLNQMRTESSGNPRAINLTDSNAQRGTPSKGLMQVIDPTFRSYALAGYNSDIYDPLSNIIASIRYVLSRYGSIPAGMRGVAYQFGGMVPDLFGGGIDSVPAMLTPGEAVLTQPEVSAYRLHAQALAGGFGGQVVDIRLRGEGPLLQAIADASEVTVAQGFRAYGDELRTQAGVG